VTIHQPSESHIMSELPALQMYGKFYLRIQLQVSVFAIQSNSSKIKLFTFRL